MRVFNMYRSINDKTWILQVLLDFILIFFYYRNPKICSLLRQFICNKYLMFAILGFGNVILIRVFILLLSWIICMFNKG